MPEPLPVNVVLADLDSQWNASNVVEPFFIEVTSYDGASSSTSSTSSASAITGNNRLQAKKSDNVYITTFKPV